MGARGAFGAIVIVATASAGLLSPSVGARALANPAPSATTLPPATTTLPPATTTAPSTTTTVPGAPTTIAPPPVTTTTPPAISAQKLLASAIGAANSQKAIDWVVTMGGPQAIREAGHAGRVDGTETVGAVLGGRRLQMSVVVVGRIAYVTADSAGLAGFLGFTPAAAKTEAGKWIAVPDSDESLYLTLANGITVSTATSSLDMVGELTELPQTVVHGHSAVGIRGKRNMLGLGVVQTVYVAASGVPLPLEVVVSIGAQSETLAFGPWGVPPHAVAPASSVVLDTSWLG